MKYVGSKRRIGKELWDVISKYYNESMTYIEPFVGGSNMIQYAKSKKRIGIDNNKYLISLFKALQNGYIPPLMITKDEHLNIKNNKEKYPEELVAFAGICCSYSGRWFDSYAKYNNRNFALEGYVNLKKQLPLIADVEFIYSDYKTYNYDRNSLIYCDPPYQSNNRMYCTKKFNHEESWEWAINMSKNDYLIFISEYNAPDEFECIWQKGIKTTNKGKGYYRIEKLFKFKG